jgi:hypothetical protein
MIAALGAGPHLVDVATGRGRAQLGQRRDGDDATQVLEAVTRSSRPGVGAAAPRHSLPFWLSHLLKVRINEEG